MKTDPIRESTASNGVKIIPTVVPLVLQDVTDAARRYAFAKMLHLDIADGIFAPNTTWTLLPGESLPERNEINYEVHLMVEHPFQPGLTFARAGARRLIAHIESFPHAERASDTFDMWRKAGAEEIGVAILLDTPLEDVRAYVELTDFVHVMTIARVGEQGIPFDERGIERVAEIHAQYPTLVIAVDGGTSAETVGVLRGAGASRFCVGSDLASAENPGEEYSRLLSAASAA
jgi:ribulose-phosphate 3-epimerase